MNECGVKSPHEHHNECRCNLPEGHGGGLHKCVGYYGSFSFWTEDAVRHANKFRVRFGLWLARKR